MNMIVSIITTIGLCLCLGISDVTSDTKWGSWKPKTCRRRCSDSLGLGEYERDCLLCREGTWCNVTDPSRCDGPALKVSSCYVGNECTGDGVYIGQMSPWIPASLCPHPNLPCNGKMRMFTRTCLRTDKSTSGDVKCPGDKHTERQEPCICGVDDPAAIAVSDPDWGWLPMYGVWSAWSEWNCEQPCVNVTRRTRQCIRESTQLFDCPMDAEGRLDQEVMPCHINGESLCRTQGEDVLCPGGSCLKHWSSWTEWSNCHDGCEDGQMRQRDRKCLNTHAPCFGDAEERKPCLMNETICQTTGPHRVARAEYRTHGDWSQWSPYQCSICGKGNKYRTRTCTDPWPEGFGNDCKGTGYDDPDQECNANACPTTIIGDNIKVLSEKAMIELITVNDAILGSQMTINCHELLLKVLYDMNRSIRVYFQKNGADMPAYNDRITFSFYVPESATDHVAYLTLNNVEHSDAGTYTCNVESQGSTYVLNLIAFTVISPPVLEVEVGSRVTLDCKAQLMNRLKNGLEHIWKHNNFKVGVPASLGNSNKIFESVTMDDQGYWECYVFHHDTRRITKTAVLKLIVKTKTTTPGPTDESTTHRTTTDSGDLDTNADELIRLWQLESLARKGKTRNIKLALFGLLLSKLILLIMICCYWCEQNEHLDEQRSPKRASLHLVQPPESPWYQDLPPEAPWDQYPPPDRYNYNYV